MATRVCAVTHVWPGRRGHTLSGRRDPGRHPRPQRRPQSPVQPQPGHAPEISLRGPRPDLSRLRCRTVRGPDHLLVHEAISSSRARGPPPDLRGRHPSPQPGVQGPFPAPGHRSLVHVPRPRGRPMGPGHPVDGRGARGDPRSRGHQTGRRDVPGAGSSGPLSTIAWIASSPLTPSPKSFRRW